MQGVVSLEDEMRLFKLGRRTGFTAGTLNGVREADVHRRRKTDQGDWESVKGKSLVVVPKSCVIFGDPGDSGSFVVDGDGQFAGLYCGGDGQRGTGLFIEATDLFDDIKLITGASDVRVPAE
jgi:hypothetical protein